MKRFSLLVTSIIVASTSGACLAQNDTKVPLPTSSRWQFEIAGSLTFAATPSIIEGDTADEALTTGLGKSHNYQTFSPQIGILLPFYNNGSFSLEALAHLSYMSMNTVSANSPNSDPQDPIRRDGEAHLRGNQINYTVGVNLNKFTGSDYFWSVAAGGGVGQREYSGAWSDNPPLGTDNESGTLTTFTPFGMIEAGIGKQISQTSRAKLFVRYNRFFDNDQVLLTPGPDGEAYMRFLPARSFWGFGLSVTC